MVIKIRTSQLARKIFVSDTKNYNYYSNVFEISSSVEGVLKF